MARIVSASEANQNFSKLLGEAEDGETIMIQRRGITVAQLIPTPEKARERRIAAAQRMVAFFEKWPIVTTGPWTRDELYEDDFSK